MTETSSPSPSGRIRVVVYDAEKLPERQRVFSMTRKDLSLGQLLMMSSVGSEHKINVQLDYTGTFEVAVPRCTFGPLYGAMLGHLRKAMRRAGLSIYATERHQDVAHEMQLVDGEEHDGVRGDMFVNCTHVYSTRPDEVLDAMKSLEASEFICKK